MLQLLSAAGLDFDDPGWADRVRSFIDGIVDFIRAHPSLQADWRDPLLGPPMALRARAQRQLLAGELAVDLRAAGVERSGVNALTVAEVFLTIVQSGIELAICDSDALFQQQILLEVRWAATEYLSSYIRQ